MAVRDTPVPTAPDPCAGDPAARVLARAAAATRALLAAAALAVPVTWALGGPAPGSLPAAVGLGLAAGGLVLGLPHGAVDHVLATRLTGWSMRRLLPAYVAVAALAWALLELLGLPALLVVLGVSLLHFAAGEVEVARATWSWPLDRTTSWAVGLAGTGALLVPLARADAAWREVATAVHPDLGSLVTQPWVRAAVAGLWALAALVAVTSALRAGLRGPALDVLVLLAVALLLPPLAAFGLWFGLWHGGRHLARLLAEEPGAAAHLAAGRPRAAAGHLARVAAWPTLAALAAGAAVVAATTATGRADQALAHAVQVLLALTVPHMLVVLGLDRRGTATPLP